VPPGFCRIIFGTCHAYLLVLLKLTVKIDRISEKYHQNLSELFGTYWIIFNTCRITFNTCRITFFTYRAILGTYPYIFQSLPTHVLKITGSFSVIAKIILKYVTYYANFRNYPQNLLKFFNCPQNLLKFLNCSQNIQNSLKLFKILKFPQNATNSSILPKIFKILQNPQKLNP
jgi:hypothetical protein